MAQSRIRQNVFPVLAAFIWGTAFVAQSVCTDYVEPFTFNAVRGIIAFLVLLLVAYIFSKSAKKRGEAAAPKFSFKYLIIGGFICGTLLAAASNLQQAALSTTSPGKAGFITAMYVVLVPVFGIFLRKRATFRVWISVMLSALGLYLLCIKESFSLAPGDSLLLLSAAFFAVHIFCIDYFVQRVDAVQLSCVQFLISGIWSAILMLIFESPSIDAIMLCIWPILYVSIFSSAVAYTLQILSMKGSDPTIVTILLSLESVFSVVAGAVILGDQMQIKEYIGCVVMFAAVILAQLPPGTRRRKKNVLNS